MVFGDVLAFCYLLLVNLIISLCEYI